MHMLLAHPRDDDLFVQIATHQVELVDDGSRTITGARRGLRAVYRDADLHRQARVNVRDVPTTVWFAYRDGRLSPSMPFSRWWTGRSVALAAMDASGRLSRANAQFRMLVGLPPEPVGHEALGDRVDEETCRQLRKLARSLSPSRDTSGTLEIRLPWGKRQGLEFHARRLPAASGGYSLELRSLEERDSTLTDAATAAGLGSASTVERQGLLSRGRRRRLDPGEGLGLASHRAWAALVVLGIVRLFAHADGMEPTLAYAGPGALVGTHLVHAHDATPIDLQAVAPSVVMLLPPNRIRDLIRAEAPFANAVVDHAQTFVGSTVATLAARTGADLSQRLAREITLLADLFPAEGLIPVTEQQLADGVGSIRESVARTLGDFRRDGWVATTRHGLLVLDGGAVRRAAGPNGTYESGLVLGRGSEGAVTNPEDGGT